jgi:hypothetical protein
MNVLIVDTANTKQAPTIKSFLETVFAGHDYTSKGVSAEFAAEGENLTVGDIQDADIIVFAETMHYRAALLLPAQPEAGEDPAIPGAAELILAQGTSKTVYTLDIAGFDTAEEATNEDYLTQAYTKLYQTLYSEA